MRTLNRVNIYLHIGGQIHIYEEVLGLDHPDYEKQHHYINNYHIMNFQKKWLLLLPQLVVYVHSACID